MIYHYSLPWVVLDSTTATLITNRNDGVLLDRSGNEVPATTPLGVPTKIATGPAGTTVAFHASISGGRVRFGNVEAAVFADENLDAAERAEAAAAAAAETLASMRRIETTASEITYIYRDTAGDVWVSSTPVLQGGGKPRVTAEGDVIVDFTS